MFGSMTTLMDAPSKTQIRREHARFFSPAIGRELDVIAYGHAGQPVLVFPSSEGKANDYEGFGMVDALSPLLRAGKLRLYCVDSYDSESWWSKRRPPHERASRHTLYEDWIMNHVLPAIRRDGRDPKARLIATGCSFGAYHAANFTLKHPRHFRLALCMSGAYDIRWLLDGHHDEWVYFNNPIEYVANMQEDLLDQLRRNVFITLVSGQGQWEQRSLESTREFWGVLSRKRLPNYMDLWGHDVAHDWPWWRKQIVHYLSHFVEGRTPWPNISLV
jgi:esterase/lipase superfamily enzyme